MTLDTYQAIETRRSVKNYDPEHLLSNGEVRRLLSLAMLSPTSFNIQNWRFVNVVDRELRAQICNAAWNQKQIIDASLLLVLCADLKAWDRAPSRYWRNSPAEVQERLVPMITDFYRGRDQLQRDEAMRSVGMAAQTLMIAARAMGYDSNPMIGVDQEAVSGLIGLPEDHVVGMLLVIGKAVRPANSRGGQLEYDEVVIRDRFQG